MPKAENSSVEKAKQECQALVNFLLEQPDIEPFTKPVDWEALGLDDYLETIKQPMDLETVQTRLKQNKYGNTPGKILTAFAADVALIFENAMTYNQDGSEIYNSAAELLAKFRSKIPAPPADERKQFSQLIARLNDNALADLVDLLYRLCPEAVGSKDGSGLVVDLSAVPDDCMALARRFAQGCLGEL